MPRYPTDANDRLVWLLDESSGNYRNTGTLNPNSSTTDLVPNLNYSYSSSVSTGATFISGVTDTGNHCDDCVTGSISLPFTFTFYGQTFNSCVASSNGYVEFGNNVSVIPTSIPNGSLNFSILCFCMDETTGPGGRGIFTTTVGSAPSRQFIIEFRNAPLSAQATTLNYELILTEGSQNFDVIYTTSTATVSGCIGIQRSPSISTVFSNSTTIPAAGTKITWTANTTPSYLVRTGNGLYNGNCVQIPGNANYPTGGSTARNWAAGANTSLVTPPMTVSCWVNLRSYTTANNTFFIAKEFRDPNTVYTWTEPFMAIMLGTGTGNGGLDWFVSIATTTTTRTTFTVTDFPIPLGVWSHVGFTLDGTSLRLYLNGCQMMTYSGLTQNLSTPASSLFYTNNVDGYGPWRIGGVLNIGDGNKEEANAFVQDVRIANVARPLSYFKDVYRIGVFPLTTAELRTYASIKQYYKLRAYDLACSTPTAVFWVDQEISLANAPAFPCGGPYSAPEVIDTWFA